MNKKRLLTLMGVGIKKIPYSVDFSTLSDGGLPARFSGSTWSINTGVALNTPTLGDELVANGGFETYTGTQDDGIGDTFDGWSILLGTNGVVESVTDVNSGSSAVKMLSEQASRPNVNKTITSLTAHNWYLLSGYIKTAEGGRVTCSGQVLTSAPNNLAQSTTQTYSKVYSTRRTLSTSFKIDIHSALANKASWVDDVSLKLITKSEIFALVSDSNIRDCTVKTNISALGSFSCAGVVLNVDDETNPLNYVLVYIYNNGYNTTCAIDNCINGQYQSITELGNITYNSAHNLMVTKSGDNYSVYYGAAGSEIQVGTTTEITGKTGLTHGLFSLNEGNTFTAFELSVANP